MHVKPVGCTILAFYFPIGFFEHPLNVFCDNLIQAAFVHFIGQEFRMIYRIFFQ